MTTGTLSELTQLFHDYVHPKTNDPAPLVSEEHYQIVMKNKEKLDAAVDHTRDFEYDYFGFKTMEKSYLLKIQRIDGTVCRKSPIDGTDAGSQISSITHIKASKSF